jgi:hypothetical protein
MTGDLIPLGVRLQDPDDTSKVEPGFLAREIKQKRRYNWRYILAGYGVALAALALI